MKLEKRVAAQTPLLIKALEATGDDIRQVDDKIRALAHEVSKVAMSSVELAEVVGKLDAKTARIARLCAKLAGHAEQNVVWIEKLASIVDNKSGDNGTTPHIITRIEWLCALGNLQKGTLGVLRKESRAKGYVIHCYFHDPNTIDVKATYNTSTSPNLDKMEQDLEFVSHILLVEAEARGWKWLRLITTKEAID